MECQDLENSFEETSSSELTALLHSQATNWRKDEKESSPTLSTDKKSSYLGMFLALLAAFMFAVNGVVVECLEQDEGYHPFTLSVFRFQGLFLPSLPIFLYFVTKIKLFEPIWPIGRGSQTCPRRKRGIWLILRCLIGTTSIFFHFFALARLDVSDVLVIGAGKPVFVQFIAYFVLSEPCGLLPVFSSFLMLIGVGILSRPPFITGEASFNFAKLIGTGLSLATMITMSLVVVILRFLKDLHFSLIIFTVGLWGTLQSLVFSGVVGEFQIPGCWKHWALIGALAGSSFLSQVGLTLALKYEQAGTVALLRTSESLFAFVLQYVFFGIVPDSCSLAGAVVIIFSVFLVTFTKWISTLHRDHPCRKIFSFLLL